MAPHLFTASPRRRICNAITEHCNGAAMRHAIGLESRDYA